MSEPIKRDKLINVISKLCCIFYIVFALAVTWECFTELTDRFEEQTGVSPEDVDINFFVD